MAGYAASSRLQGTVTRFVGANPNAGDTRIAAASLATEASPTPAEPPIVDQLELVGRPLGDTIRDWLASIGESWSQLTFYLFDPESWR